MEEIAYDIPLHYPLPAKNVEWGEVSTHTKTHTPTEKLAESH